MASDNILVAIKSRPFITREKAEKLKPQWNIRNKTIYQIDEDNHKISEPYSFDHIFNENDTNEVVYKSVVEPLVDSCLKGFNSTIFAYGQTSSGKTHTMMGSDDTKGIIQMAVGNIFDQLERNKNRRYLVSCSYFEIYNEKINDLLDKTGNDLKIREDFYGNTFVNAKEEVVTAPVQVFNLMKVGNKIRKIGCTNMNERSSRSHTIFRFRIESTENNIENGPVQVSQLNLVDLAGSERMSHTKVEGVRLKEGVNINKSLSVLGNVIRQLSESEGFINYRDSKLTRLLQHALGGNAKSLIIATITLAAGEETKSTLEFAQRAKVIKNKPIINEILTELDKVKQYELITAGYIQRLEMEKLRIEEMEREKEEREREISKLKQHVKLINVFTKGPKVMNTESKISRRHTVGHYGSRPLLQTIPESSILPDISEIENNGIKHDVDNIELPSVDAYQSTDDDFQSVLNESLEEILTTTPEPPEESNLSLEQASEGTPSYFLRKRLKYLEESYNSLQEFTKLEAECKDKDKGLVADLIKEKENLLKDLVELNAIIREERQQKETLKLNFEERLSSLTSELSCQKKKNDELGFALEQLQAEKDKLKQLKEDELNDSKFLLDRQKLKHEEQAKYLKEEIEKLNKELSAKDKEIVNRPLQPEIEKITQEKKLLHEKTEQLKEQIQQLQNELSKYQNREREDQDTISKLYILQDILMQVNSDIQGVSTQTELDDIELDNKNKLEIEIKRIKEEKVVIEEQNEEFERSIKLLKEKIEQVESLNSKLVTEVHEKNKSVLEIEKATEDQRKAIDEKEDRIKLLLQQISNLESNKFKMADDNENYKKEIAVYKETEKNYENLKKEFELKEKNIHLLMDNIQSLESKILEIQHDNEDYQSKITLYKQQEENNGRLQNVVKQKEETIKSLMEKIDSLEKCKLESEKDNQVCKKQIAVYKETEKNYENLKKEFELKEKDIHRLMDNIQNLESKILEIQHDNEDYQSKITLYKQQEENNGRLQNEVKQKEETIKLLMEKIDSLEKCKLESEKDNQVCKKQIAVYKETEKNYENLKKEFELKEKNIHRLMDNIQNLESKILEIQHDNEDYQSKITLYKQQEENNGRLQNEVKRKEETIKSLMENIDSLEKCKLESEKDNQVCKKQIAVYKETEKNYENLKKEFQLKEKNIHHLMDNIQNLESKILEIQHDNEDYQSKIRFYKQQEENNGRLQNEVKQKEETIKSLMEKIDSLEKCKLESEKDNQVCKKQIAVCKETEKNYEKLRNALEENEEKIKTLEKENESLRIRVPDHKNDEVKLLRKKIEDLEKIILKIEQENEGYTKDITVYKEHEENNKKLTKEIQQKDEQIKLLLNKIDDLEHKTMEQDDEKYEKELSVHRTAEKPNENLRIDVEQKEEKIKGLLKKIRGLEREITVYKQIEKNNVNLKKEVKQKEKTEKDLLDKIQCLELWKSEVDSENNSYKKEIQRKDHVILELKVKEKEIEKEIELKEGTIQEQRNNITDICNKLVISLHIISDLAEKLNSQTKTVNQLSEEKGECTEIAILTELLLLNTVGEIEKKIQDHENILKKHENQLKSNMQSRSDSIETDQFVSCLSEMQAIIKDPSLKKKIADILLRLKQGENPMHLFKEVSKILNKIENPDYIYYFELLNKFLSLMNEQTRCSVEAQNAKLQSKILKEQKYLQYLEQLLMMVTNGRDLQQKVDRTDKLRQQNIRECQEKQLGRPQNELSVASFDGETNQEVAVASKTEVLKLKDRIKALATENRQLKTVLGSMDSENGQENRRSRDLGKETRKVPLDNVSLTTKGKENVLKELKPNSQVEKSDKRISQCSSSIWSPIADLTPKDIVRKRRQSIHDQRRGIDIEGDVLEQEVAVGKETEVVKLEAKVQALTAENQQLKLTLRNMESEIKQEKERNRDLHEKLRNMHSKNVSLTTKISDIEKTVAEPKSNLQAENTAEKTDRRSVSSPSTSRPTIELSATEVRRRKRQSIQDQRRGIDTEADTLENVEEQDSTRTEKELRATIARLTVQVEHLKSENVFLESEVQGFIREMDDCKRYDQEEEAEIKDLQRQLEEAKRKQQACQECSIRQNHIKQLEDLQKKNNYKIVDLQTKIFDLQNTYKIESSKHVEKFRQMKYRITQLKARLGDQQPKELKSVEIQTDLRNCDYENLLEKYNNTRKLARFRREEGNILRARLGMNPDEPVT